MTSSVFRTAFVVAALGSALSAHAGLFVIAPFDQAFFPGPIEISAGWDRAIASSYGYYNGKPFGFTGFYRAMVDANEDATGAQKLRLQTSNDQLQFETDPEVDGSLTITLTKVTNSGPTGAYGFNLGEAFAGLQFDFAALDQDLNVSYSALGERAFGESNAVTVSGMGTIAAGSTRVDLPLDPASGTLSALQNMTINLDMPKGTNFRLNDLAIRTTPVPEPASMAALGFGLVAMVRRRRSRA